MPIGIWNNIDEAALYLGLSRLDGESNDEFVNRIKQFSRWKYRTDYYTQSHSIPLQLGLNTDVIGRINNKNGNKYICNIDWEYFTLQEVLPDQTMGEYIRVFISNLGCTLSKIVTTINNSNTFTCVIYNPSDLTVGLDYIIRNKNIKLNNIQTNGKYSYLDHKDIVQNSVRFNDPSYRRVVSSLQDLKRSGDYFIDYDLGFIQTFDLSPAITNVAYSYYDKTFSIEKTELSLIPLNKYFNYGLTDTNISLIPDILDGLICG